MIEEKDYYSRDTTLDMKTVYIYDLIRNLIEEDYYAYARAANHGNSYVDSFQLIDKYCYRYDSNGNRLEFICYQPSDNILFKDTYIYNKEGVAIEENLAGLYIEKFNSEGDITGIYKLNKPKNLVWESSYKYEYDKKGNWTKESIHEIGRPIEQIERVIEYY